VRPKLNADIFELIYQVLVNLGSGWYGAVFIISNYFQNKPIEQTLFALTINIFFGTVSLVFALSFKNLAKKLNVDQ